MLLWPPCDPCEHVVESPGRSCPGGWVGRSEVHRELDLGWRELGHRPDETGQHAVVASEQCAGEPGGIVRAVADKRFPSGLRRGAPRQVHRPVVHPQPRSGGEEGGCIP